MLVSQLTKGKQALTQQLEELKRQLDEETKVRTTVPGMAASDSTREPGGFGAGGRPGAAGLSSACGVTGAGTAR